MPLPQAAMFAYFLKLLIAAGCALFAYYMYGETDPPGQYLYIGFFGLLGLMAVWPQADKRRKVANLGGFSWNREDFCRGWLITGDTGSGKTTSGVISLAEQVYRHDPQVGGIVIDDKGVLFETFAEILKAKGRKKDVILLQTRPDTAPPDWKPQHCFNSLSDNSIPPNTLAKMIVDTASGVQRGGDKAFFKTNSQLQIGKAIETMRLIGVPFTLKNLYDYLTNDMKVEEMIGLLTAVPDEHQMQAVGLVTHWIEGYQRQPPEQRGGVKSTIVNYLEFFTPPDIAEVFCPDQNSFEFSAIDRGALICVAMPQKYQTERRYIATFLKILYYVHVLRRFDQPKSQRAKNNLLILWADEAQNFVTETEGISDHSTVDRIREAGGTIVAATQSQTSFYPPLTREKARVFTLNLRNRLIFKAADEECAKESADFIGRRRIVKRSWGYQGGRGSVNYSHDDEYRFKLHILRTFKNHICVVAHCQKGFRKCLLKPREPNGRVCQWYRARFWGNK